MKKHSSLIWPILAALFFVLFLVAISLHIWGLRPWGTAIDYSRAGPWAEFISGLGSVSTALIAYSAIFLESRRARAAEAAILNRSNTQVFCWFEPRGLEGGREWLLCFENGVGVPIRRWLTLLVGHEQSFSSKELGPIRPRASQLRVETFSGWAHAAVPDVRLTFMDPTGTCWTRTEEGTLIQASISDLEKK